MTRGPEGSADASFAVPAACGDEPALPPRWIESARFFEEAARPTRLPSTPIASDVPVPSRDFRSGPRADGLPTTVARGLRWLDAEVRGPEPNAAAQLLAQRFQTGLSEALDFDRVFLPEETVAYAAGRALAGLVATAPGPTPSTVAIARSASPQRQRVWAAWCARLGLRVVLVDDPSERVDALAWIVESPNVAGVAEPLAAWRSAAGTGRPLLLCSTDPLVLFTQELAVGRVADIAIFDVAALAPGGDEAAAVATHAAWSTAIGGLFVDASDGPTRLRRSDGGQVEDEPDWPAIYTAALLTAELGSRGFRRRARAVQQRRRWLETQLERRGIPVVTARGVPFRETTVEVPRWSVRQKRVRAEGFDVDAPECNDGRLRLRPPLSAGRRDVMRLAEVLAGG